MENNAKIYVIFDPVNDKDKYSDLCAFTKDDKTPFDFYNSARYLKDLDKVSDENLKALIQNNMDDANIYLVLLSKTVKSMRRFVKWQIEYAVSKNRPLIVMNDSRIRSMDNDITPTLLKNRLSLFIPNDSKALELACNNWPKSYKEHSSNGDNIPYQYDEATYKQLYNEDEKGE